MDNSLSNLFNEVSEIIINAKSKIYSEINKTMTYAYYNIGRKIVLEEQNGKNRAEYGKQIINNLSDKLTKKFGKGYSVRNLELIRKFNIIYSEAKVIAYKNEKSNKVVALNQTNSDNLQPLFLLSWSHYIMLMRISNPMERAFYEIESINNRWSKRELERQFKSSLFERLAVNKSKDKIKLLSNEGEKINENKDLFRDPFIFEFVGLPSDNLNNESKLETELINKVEHFLLEFGKYFTFVARQKRITIEDDHFYVDIVLYNRYLRCFVLVDLKMGKLTHQDLGQIQMYTNYFDKYEKLENENNTIGIVLCRDKNESMIKISLPNNDNIFASRFTTVFPNKSELKNLLNKKM